VREYLLVLLVAAAVTYLLTVVAREIAIRTGAVAIVRDRDMHVETVTYLGGLAMLGGLGAAYVVARQLPFLSQMNPVDQRKVSVVVLTGALICALGVIDDIIELDALTKLGGQIVAASLLVTQQVKYVLLPLSPQGDQFTLDPAQASIATVIIVVATVNAVNFVDGLDGLAAGVIAIGALAFFVYCFQLAILNKVSSASPGALLSAALAGACLGFLPHNVHPARLFMGDSGSMLLGLVLSASAITVSGNYPGDSILRGINSEASWLPTVLPLVLPLSLLIVPFGDLVLAVVRRTRARRSPFAPDKQHLHHRMLEIGHSHRRAVLILWLWAALVAFGTVTVSLTTGPLMWTWLALAALVTVVATFVLPILQRPGGGTRIAGRVPSGGLD
jgi:UDP-GlcNAc:undecaprenyl-phosphate/decaprenyl-phosphate GlcNAc-1-phosphate transferase